MKTRCRIIFLRKNATAGSIVFTWQKRFEVVGVQALAPAVQMATQLHRDISLLMRRRLYLQFGWHHATIVGFTRKSSLVSQ